MSSQRRSEEDVLQGVAAGVRRWAALRGISKAAIHAASGFAAALLLAAVVACETGSSLPPGSADVRLGDGRKSASASMNGIVHVELLGNDGTGYEWRLAAIDRALLEPIGKPHVTPVDPGIRGGRTITTFEFRPLVEGTTTLVFEYVRPWAPEPPGKVAQVEVTIGGGR